jgi:hypothetical protein
MDTPQEHGVKVHGQVHGHTDAWRVGKVLKVYMPRAMALGSGTEFLEFTLHGTGHLNLSLWQRRSTAAANGQAGAGIERQCHYCHLCQPNARAF